MRHTRLSALAFGLGLAVTACADATEPPLAANLPAARDVESAPGRAPAVSEITLPNGVRLEYAEGGKPGGEPVIMLHGYTDSGYSFSRVLPRLNPNLHAFSLSQRGHGDSDRPLTGYASEDFAADVDAFMAAKGIDRAVVVGHSMGSFIAQTFAIRYPHRVKALVLVGSATVAGNEVVLGLRDFVRTLTDPVDSTFVHEFQASTVFHPVPADFLDAVVAESRKLPARVWIDALDGLVATDNAPRLGEVAAPTLIVWGEHDSIFPRSEQDLLDAAIPNSTLLVYRETGHAPHWERPAEFTKDLEKFIQSLD
ncbi:MAG TPA: alpha/beta hydrolase [Longimicrobium sp.]|nr:alpha/beta hydrolase [Longimicrobium sp.]